MFGLNLSVELKSIFRNHWLTALVIVLLSLCLYSGYNGSRHAALRDANIVAAIDEMHRSDDLLLARLDSISNGMEIGLPSWQYPNLPTSTGDTNPRVAAFQPGEMSFIATGQSDMFNHYVKPTLTGDSFSIAFTELSSPVSLLLGNFDPSFVLVYLLPLLIISFCYNILSSEKEHGSLVLVASNPLSLRIWLLQKIFIRYLTLSILLSICLVLMLFINGVGITGSSIQFIGIVWIYSAFWFALSYFINLRGKSSGNNAISLIGIWVCLVLAVPSLLNQLSHGLYPTPSRAMLINEMRTQQAEIEKEQDKILDGFLRDHPELISREAEESSAYGWWQRFFASKDVVVDRMQPLLDEYDNNLKEQQNLVDRLSFLSPAILFQSSLVHMSETSTQHYQNYRANVISFSQEWRNFFLPLIFQEKDFEKEMLAELPEFKLDEVNLSSPIGLNTALILLITLGLIGAGFKLQTTTNITSVS